MSYQEAADKAKTDIILHVLAVMEDKDSAIVNAAIESLRKFSRYYRIHMRLNPGKPLGLSSGLRQFIINGEGYVITINNLYKALLNVKESATN